MHDHYLEGDIADMPEFGDFFGRAAAETKALVADKPDGESAPPLSAMTLPLSGPGSRYEGAEPLPPPPITMTPLEMLQEGLWYLDRMASPINYSGVDFDALNRLRGCIRNWMVEQMKASTQV